MRNSLNSCLVVLLLAACNVEPNLESAEEADEILSTASIESALSLAVSEDVSFGEQTGQAVAARAAPKVLTRFQNAECITSEINGADVLYTLTNCTGPYGLVRVTGQIRVTYNVTTGGKLTARIVGTGITVNDKSTLNLNVNVSVQQNNSNKQANVLSESSVVGPRGYTLNRIGEYQIHYDTVNSCITLDGVWKRALVTASAQTTVTAFQKCLNKCPGAGGKIVNTSASGKTVTLSFDGTSVAKWASEDGKSGTLNLQCQ